MFIRSKVKYGAPEHLWYFFAMAIRISREDGISVALAAVLRAETAKADLRQADVAQAIGKSPAYLSQRWRGEASLTVDDLTAWSSLLGIEPSLLISSALADISR